MLESSRLYPAETLVSSAAGLPTPLGGNKEMPSLILVEPDLCFLPDRALMLTEAYYRVTTVRDIRELASLSIQSTFAIALLSELLGPAALESAARLVRTQWPAARILFLGASQRMLEDHLYDERIAPSCTPHELLKAIEALDRALLGARPFIVPALNGKKTAESMPLPYEHQA
jgi:hypothetical protein